MSEADDEILPLEEQREGDRGYYAPPPAPKKGRLHELILRDPVAQLNAPAPIVLSRTDTVATAIEKMRAKRFGSVIVADGDRIRGIFTEHDLVREFGAGGRDPARVKLEEVMTSDPRSIRQGDSLALALNYMAHGGYRHIPVVEDDRPVGFISIRGILHYLAENALLPERTRAG
jgi:CBS domain-containing protein